MPHITLNTIVMNILFRFYLPQCLWQTSHSRINGNSRKIPSSYTSIQQIQCWSHTCSTNSKCQKYHHEGKNTTMELVAARRDPSAVQAPNLCKVTCVPRDATWRSAWRMAQRRRAHVISANIVATRMMEPVMWRRQPTHAHKIQHGPCAHEALVLHT